MAPPAERVYNQAAAIAIASNKLRCRRVLEQAEIPVPEESMTAFPVVGRTVKHRAGRGFWLCNSEDDIGRAVARGARYFSVFYPKQNEYRVHIAHGSVLYVQEKVPRESEEYKRDWPIWNHAINDFQFRIIRWSYWPLDIILLATKAVSTVGLDYGAIDIMANPKEDGFPPAVVCEINTGMSIDSDYSAIMYQTYFRWLLEEHPEESLKPVSNKPQGYAFKKIIGVENSEGN